MTKGEILHELEILMRSFRAIEESLRRLRDLLSVEKP